MKIVAYYGKHLVDVPLEEGMFEAFSAMYGPHQALADELREQLQADELVITHHGELIVESRA